MRETTDPGDPTASALTSLAREVRTLRACVRGLAAALGLVLICGAGLAYQRPKFEEIDVGRLNIVEKDGTLRMALSNKERFPEAVLDGKVLGGRVQGATPGIIFYNDAGECGGLSFDAATKDGKTAAGMSLTFDQFRQDQTIGLQYDEEGGVRRAALKFWDRPDVPLSEVAWKYEAARKMPDGPAKDAAYAALSREMPGPLRLVVGKDEKRASVIMLADDRGRPRIHIAVDPGGDPRIEFLDEAGKVIQRLPSGPAK